MQAHGTLLPSLYKVEEELCRKIGLKPDSEFQTQLLGPVIAIGGLSGVGKDTLAAGIQKEFKLSFNKDLFVFSAGTLMRESARQLG
ncbi:MAG TPA: hypothetical protein VJ044_04425, partial [Candidatus Hodarchaeales archaeon]|nr:hypothetical protein [Candidatus Hodarchaeales archaeon]